MIQKRLLPLRALTKIHEQIPLILHRKTWPGEDKARKCAFQGLAPEQGMEGNLPLQLPR